MKRSLMLVLALMLVVSTAACKTSPQVETSMEPSASMEATPAMNDHEIYLFSVMVEGVEDATEFNQDHYNDMDIQTVTLTITKDGTPSDYECTGVLFSDVLIALGVTEYTSVTVVAVDGYEKTYDKAVIEENTTFFVLEVNGETEDCPGAFAASMGSEYIIKNVQQLIVE